MWKFIFILAAISFADCKIDITPKIVGGNDAVKIINSKIFGTTIEILIFHL